MATLQIFGTKKCRDTKRAERFFKERGLKFQRVDLADKGLSKGELTRVAQAVGGVEALLDADGKRIVERGLQHAGLSGERLFDELLEDPLLLNTPIVRCGHRACVGRDEAGWKQLLIKL